MENKNINVAFYTKSITNAYDLRNKCKRNGIDISYLADLDNLIVEIISNPKGVMIIDIKYLRHLRLISSFCQFRNNGEYKFIYLAPSEKLMSADEEDISIYTYEEMSKLVDNLPQIIDEINNKSDNDKMIFVSNMIAEILESYKISPKYMGFSYLKDCIEIVSQNKFQAKRLNTDVYPIIAKKYNTTVANVEKGIRITIKQASISHPELYGKDTFCCGKITNRKFVTHIVEEIDLYDITK